jgi:beta-N-acetylhexosaminidase
LWTEHLRNAMGFDGVIITDALDMDAVADGRGIQGVADAAVRALRAGADFLCLGSNFDEAMTSTVIDRVFDAALDRPALERSRQRISTLRRPASRPPAPDGRAAQIVAERAVVIDGVLPAGPFAVVECRPRGSMACFNVTWGIANDLHDRDWPTTMITASDPIDQACAAVLDSVGAMPIVVVVRDACVHQWQTTVIDTLVRARPASVAVVELGWPGVRPAGCVAYVASHGAARCSAQAVIDLLALPILETER